MAADYFLKFGDIKGESQDDRHRDQIVVLSWSWGVTAQVPANPGGGGIGGGKTFIQDLNVMHAYDKASPLLMKACATLQRVPEATLTARTRGEGNQDFLVIKMTDVVILSVMSGAPPDELITETMTLHFGKVAVSYSAQKADGTLEPPVVFGYDLTANRPI